jgi:hypothetical protein
MASLSFIFFRSTTTKNANSIQYDYSYLTAITSTCNQNNFSPLLAQHNTNFRQKTPLLSMAYPGLFWEGGFYKFSWGQRAARTEIWGRQSPSQGFRSIWKWAKPVFLLVCDGCIFHGTGNSAQLCQNFGISEGGVEPPSVRHCLLLTTCLRHVQNMKISKLPLYNNILPYLLAYFAHPNFKGWLWIYFCSVYFTHHRIVHLPVISLPAE